MIALGAASLMKVFICTTQSSCNHLFEPDDSPSYNRENIALLVLVPRHFVVSYYKNFRVYHCV